VGLLVAQPRITWTTTRAGGDRQNPINPILFVHYSDSPGVKLDSWSEQRDAVRAIRDYHVSSNGWADIGYNYVVTQPWANTATRTWTGRGRYRIPAAQQGANYGNLAVCVIANSEERIFDDTVRAIAKLAQRVGARKVMGHRDVNDTDCPGDALYAKLPRIRKLARL
jgi:hypothetical protein